MHVPTRMPVGKGYEQRHVSIGTESGNSKNVCKNPLSKNIIFCEMSRKEQKRECEMHIIYFQMHVDTIILYQTLGLI